MIVGGAVAAHDGPIAWGWLALTVLGVFAVEAAKNASGEIFDWDSGTDASITEAERTPFSGGKRVLVDGVMSRRQTAWVAGAFYLIAIVVGLAIVIVREPAVLYLGVAGLALAYFYEAPPLQLAYHGLGELAVAVSYGPVVAAGTYLVQRHTVSADVLWASAPIGLAIAAFLWVNELPDARADAAAGKRTLVVRLGRRRAAWAFAALIALAYAGVLALPLAGLSRASWGGLLGLPLALVAARRLIRVTAAAGPNDGAAELVPAQVATLVSFVLMAIGLGLGLTLSATLT
jgi:1,4-dihydroxy-2-naphthoate octaprenyltransferase